METQQTTPPEPAAERPFRVAKIELDVALEVPPPRAWAALTRDASSWWPNDFCTSPQRVKAFHLEPRLGGRFYEDWGDGNGWVWWTIYLFDADHFTLTARGLEGAASTTTVRFTLSQSPGGCVLKISERVWGDLPDNVVPSHVNGWRYLFQERFKPYVERAKTAT